MNDTGELKHVVSIGKTKFMSDESGFLYVKGYGCIGHEEDCFEVGSNLLGLIELCSGGELF